jgi:hypothetical protein
MHEERSESLLLDVINQYERVVLMVLLGDEHPWTRAELEREVAGTKGKPGDVSTAINSLYTAGLVHLSGELVIPTRPARRMEELNPGCI